MPQPSSVVMWVMQREVLCKFVSCHNHAGLLLDLDSGKAAMQAVCERSTLYRLGIRQAYTGSLPKAQEAWLLHGC